MTGTENHDLPEPGDGPFPAPSEPDNETDADTGADAGADDPEPVFGSLEEFVEYVAHIFWTDPARGVHAWCPDWWRHPEAIVRLSAMWQAFEERRHDQALGLAMWYISHAPPHLATLRDPDCGPFARCSATHGHVDAVVPMRVSPAPLEFARLPAFSVYRAPGEADEAGAAEAAGAAGTAGDADSVLVFQSLEEFVVLYVAAVFQLDPANDEYTWCPDWWRHPEAVVRLSTMWRSYEWHQGRSLLMSNWLLYYADPHLAELRDPDRGPFARCSVVLGHQDALREMPVNPPPPHFTAGVRDVPLLWPPRDDAPRGEA